MTRSDRPRRRGRGLIAGAAVLGVAALLFVIGSGSRREKDAEDAGERPTHHPGFGNGFEASDVRTRSVLVVMAIGVAVIALSVAGLFAMLRAKHAEEPAGPPLTPQQAVVIAPPGPPLQAEPLADIAALRHDDVVALSTYRWIGTDHASAQIPIERAIALVVGRPLDPAPPVAPPSGSSP